MKSVSEFAVFTLSQALKTKAALAAAGKTPEEITTEIGTAHKYEGDKLKHFMNALDVAGTNTENLRRVMVVSLNEGESVPAKANKVEEFYYVPEFQNLAKPQAKAADDGKGGRGGKGGPGGRGKGGGDKKGSPWGLSPEEKAAKKGGPKA